jgi:hypothetical protein
MTTAIEIPGLVYKRGTATLLARVVGPSGAVLMPGEVQSARYTIYELDETDPDSETPLAGHADVVLNVAEILLADLVQDDRWSVDDQGYNFRHRIDVTTDPAFPVAGLYYRVRYELVTSAETILVRFRLRCV